MKMRSSFTSAVKAREHGLARGHRYWFGRPVATHALPHPRCSIASGYLISNAADMARLLVAQLNGGTLGNLQILSPAAIDTLHRPPRLAVLACLVIVQVFAALHTLWMSRPWNRNRHRRPWDWLQLVWHAVLPPITSLGLAILLLVILPRATGLPISGLRLLMPDAGLLIVTNATFACLWAPIRMIIVARSVGALPN
jgi:hypothetical protein